MSSNESLVKESKVFTIESMPEALKNKHSIPEGLYGILHVYKGELKYRDFETAKTLNADTKIKISAGIIHWLDDISNDCQFQLKLYKKSN